MPELILRLQSLDGWRRLLAALLAGALCAAALPPFGLWPVMLVSFPVVLVLLDGVAAGPHWLRSAFATGWAFGLGYFGISLYWIGEAFLVDAEVFAWLLPFAVTALPAGLALFWGLACALAVTLWTGGACRVFVFAGCFAAAEWLRGHVLTGFPWNAPGYAADAILPLAQVASLVGLYGLCFLVILWASAPALLTRSTGRAVSLTVVAASLVASVAYGTWRLDRNSTAYHGDLEIRIVQPNIAQKEKWRPENRRWIYQRYLDMTRAEPAPASPRIVVWPESALPTWIDEQQATRQQIAQAAGARSTTVMGAIRRQSAAFNSVLAIDAAGAVAGRYDKQRLVPFGEYLPLASVLEPLGLRQLVTMPSGFQAGPGPQTLRIGALPAFASLICYEAIFPRALISRTDRPQWLLNVTNDAWFGNSVGPHQHLAQARLRAIEEGLPLVRAANTGVSAVIGPLGRVLHRLDLGEQGKIDARLPLPVAPSLYARLGDWPFLLFIFLSFICRVRTFFSNID